MLDFPELHCLMTAKWKVRTAGVTTEPEILDDHQHHDSTTAAACQFDAIDQESLPLHIFDATLRRDRIVIPIDGYTFHHSVGEGPFLDGDQGAESCSAHCI
jgi:hypothetical protein